MKRLLIQITIFVTAVSLSTFAYAQTETPQPSLQIISPVSGEPYGPEAIEFLFAVEDFTFVSYKNNTVLFPGNPNAGHAHMWIDPAPIGANSDTVYEVESADFHHLGALERGRYDMTLELVRNDHTLFSPRIFETVSFRAVEQTAPGKYVIIKTVTMKVAGEPPTGLTGVLVILIAALLILLVGIFNRLRKKGIIKTEPLERAYRKVKSPNSLGKSKITSIARKIYDKLRRKKEPNF